MTNHPADWNGLPSLSGTAQSIEKDTEIQKHEISSQVASTEPMCVNLFQNYNTLNSVTRGYSVSCIVCFALTVTCFILCIFMACHCVSVSESINNYNVEYLRIWMLKIITLLTPPVQLLSIMQKIETTVPFSVSFTSRLTGPLLVVCGLQYDG